MSGIEFKKYVVLIGNYGSGKTELALNIAADAAKQGNESVLIDMDIVNPYFRSSSKKEELEGLGIRVIHPGYANSMTEVISLPPEIYAPFDAPPDRAVFDVGGDATGASALGMLKEKFATVQEDIEFLFVINPARPLQKDAGSIIAIMDEIEQAGSVKITGLVNNANLARDTDMEMIIEAENLVDQISGLTGLPVRFTVVREDLVHLYTGRHGVYPLHIYMRPEWLDAFY